MSKRDYESEELTVTESRARLKRPPLFKVLLHNDDFTTMEFVVFVLKSVFQRADADAITIMLKVHTEGVGVAGIYTYEVAETKAAKAMDLARAQEYPLLCSVEPESGADDRG